MIRTFRYFISFFLLLLAYFFVQRTVFILYQLPHSVAISFSEYVSSNLHAFILDVAATCYMLVIPVMLWSVLLVKDSISLRKAIWWYLFFVIVVSGIIHIVDLGLYYEWGSKINHKAISCMAYPKEAIAASLSSPVWLLLFILIVESVFLLLLYKKYVHPILNGSGSIAFKLLTPVLMLGLLFIGSRGGTQDKPVRKGDVYFSNNPMINQASANSFWNFINVLATEDAGDPAAYHIMPDNEASMLVKELFKQPADSTSKLFSLSKPNFVVVLMESFSSEVVGAFGADYGATPNLDSLAATGFIMSQFYATGFRTDQGMVAIESGFPAQPKTAVIYRYGKFEKLPSLASKLVESGYQTAYYSAGDNAFANTDAYLLSAGYQKLHGKDGMKVKRMALFGAYDDELFDFYLKDAASVVQPFYHLMVTIVSHEPFDARVDKFRKGNSLLDKYINTVRYTDNAIGDFIRKARKEPWYKNTVFIFMGDHAHRMPMNRNAWETERHHIPFIVYGEPLKKSFRGTVSSRTACQSDFPSFISAQLDLPHEEFKWGNDFMNGTTPALAFYTFEDGLGILLQDTSVVFDNQSLKIINARYPGMADSVKRELYHGGQALLQQLTKAYFELGD
ncbi:MAG TPA: hypothetical protein DCR43_04555 [Bacteroidales bacterium]|nr:MAG: hypothetical protein A2X11_00950 [Bacteroidetes bacterium GWE2_42_24]OFY27471.1 MAG: hypothetical protein A2X09_07275 [Bacteroidetes bacterium GWF2_43_11]HAQ65110.1 hypothetical protein [Bacteroidales bacterium]HBZ65989.1 hypothetical protein [Bacteroidales bacterium]